MSRGARRFVMVLTASAVALVVGVAAAWAELPDGRAYEMVSPGGKYAGLGASTFLIAPFVAADGDHVLYPAIIPLPGSNNGSRNDYLATHSASGWSSETLLPPLAVQPGLFNQWYSISDDRSILYLSSESVDPADQDSSGGDLYLRRPDGTFTWISRGPVDENNPGHGFPYGIISADGSHVVFASFLPLLPEDMGRTGGNGLYDWHDGQLSLVAVNDDGTLVSTDGADLGSPSSSQPQGIGLNVVSRDGSRIFFTVDNHVYVREDGQHTVALGTPSDPSGFEVFEGATPDGSRAWITSNEQLTLDDQDSTVDLYEWHGSDNSLQRISSGPSGTKQDANVTPAAIRASDDGSRVYFRGRGTSLASGAPDLTPSDTTENLYVRDVTTTKFIATLPAFELRSPPYCGDSNWRLTPDGEHLAFATLASLVSEDTDSNVDIYEYSLASDTITLVSHGPKGGNGGFDAVLGLPFDECGSPGYNESRSMSDNGRYVFFTTDERLDNEDVNGTRDVYEHDLISGRTSLISSGKSLYPSNLLGVGASGRDVVFSAFDALAPQDQDTAQDVYDARIGGGIPLVQGPLPCVDDDCQGPAHSPQADTPPPGSATFHGHTDSGTTAVGKLSVARLSAAQSRRFARSGKTKLRIRATTAGTVTIVGRATVARKRVTVIRRTVKVEAGRTVSVTVTMTRKARAELRRRDRLVIALVVSLAPGGATQRATVRLRLPSPSPSHARGLVATASSPVQR